MLLTKNAKMVVYSVLASALASCILIILFYSHYFSGPISPDHHKWAEFGNFLGGVLGPIFTFLSLVGLLVALLIQSKQLQETIRTVNLQTLSINRQNFEIIFFEVLRNILFRVQQFQDTISDGKIALKGYQVCKNHLDKAKSTYDRKKESYKEAEDDFSIIRFSLNFESDLYQSSFVPCFQNIKFLFDYIESANLADKYKYYKLLKNQLSRSLLVLFTYHQLVEHDQNQGCCSIINHGLNPEDLISVDHYRYIESNSR